MQAVTEMELIDYVNGTLPLERRIAVEAILAADPTTAAEVMTDLRLRGDLLLALAPEDLIAAPRGRPRFRVPLAAAAVVGLAAIAFWAVFAGGLAPRLPEYVELARYSHANSQLRLAMESQIETVQIDSAEILDATGIRLPDLPPAWQIRDVQVYPSPLGPSVEIAVMTHDNGLLSIFSVRVGPETTLIPEAARSGDLPLAFFQIDGTAYVLVGATAPEPLDDEAQLLFDTLI